MANDTPEAIGSTLKFIADAANPLTALRIVKNNILYGNPWGIKPNSVTPPNKTQPAPTQTVTPRNVQAVTPPNKTQPAPTPTVTPRNVQAVTPPTTAPRSSQTKNRPAPRRKAAAKPVAKKTATTTVTRTPEQQTAYEQMMENAKRLSQRIHNEVHGIPQPEDNAMHYYDAMQNAANNAVADTLYSQLLQPQARQYGFNAMPQTAPSVVNGLDELAFELGLQPSLRQGPSLADLYTESQLVNPAVLGINDLLGGVS